MVIGSFSTARAIGLLCGEGEEALRVFLVKDVEVRFGVSLDRLSEALGGKVDFRTLLRLACQVNFLAKVWSEGWYEIKERLVWQIIDRAGREAEDWGRVLDRTKATPTCEGLWSLVIDLPDGQVKLHLPKKWNNWSLALRLIPLYTGEVARTSNGDVFGWGGSYRRATG